MGYVLHSAEGAVTSWGSTNFYSVLLAAMVPNSCTVTIEADENDITGLDVESAIDLPGLKSATARISGMLLASPKVGNTGNVTFSAGGSGVLHVNSWEWSARAPEHDITEFAGTGPTWKSFRPGGPIEITGSLNARADSATALDAPHGIGDTAPTITLRYFDTTTDCTLAGAGYLKQLSPAMQIGNVIETPYTFKGAGAWTPAGTGTPFGTSAFGIPLWSAGGSAAGALVVSTLTGSRTISFADSFWTGITVRCPINAPVMVDIDVRATGAVTLA